METNPERSLPCHACHLSKSSISLFSHASVHSVCPLVQCSKEHTAQELATTSATKRSLALKASCNDVAYYSIDIYTLRFFLRRAAQYCLSLKCQSTFSMQICLRSALYLGYVYTSTIHFACLSCWIFHIRCLGIDRMAYIERLIKTAVLICIY